MLCDTPGSKKWKPHRGRIVTSDFLYLVFALGFGGDQIRDRQPIALREYRQVIGCSCLLPHDHPNNYRLCPPPERMSCGLLTLGQQACRAGVLFRGHNWPPHPPSTWRFRLEEAGAEESRGFRDLVAHLERDLGREDAGAACAQEDEKE
jgi:hypothetical protein